MCAARKTTITCTEEYTTCTCTGIYACICFVHVLECDLWHAMKYIVWPPVFVCGALYMYWYVV